MTENNNLYYSYPWIHDPTTPSFEEKERAEYNWQILQMVTNWILNFADKPETLEMELES